MVLVNSNPATIMTDPEMADATYVEPITPKVVEEIIKKERPDALLPTMGGQTGLNTAVALAESGVLGRLGRGTHRRQAARHPVRGRSGPVQEGDARDRSRFAQERGRHHDGRGLGGGARHRLSDHLEARLHAGRLGRGRGVHRRRIRGETRLGPLRKPGVSGFIGRKRPGLEGIRARSHA